MFLRIKGYELEIIQEKFVCLGQNDGETIRFSEWKFLDPKLQEKFMAIRQELLEIIENFIYSEEKAAFDAVSEEYKQEQSECDTNKT